MIRSIRNCNPGNIRHSQHSYLGEKAKSQDVEFKQFESMAWGYRALFVVLRTYDVRYAIRTIEQMIARWAPPIENDTAAYIRFVAQRAEITADQPINTLNREQMIPIAAAIALMESGEEPDIAEMLSGWELFVKHPV